MTGRRVMLGAALLLAAMVLGVSGVALADKDGENGEKCTLAMLNGLYVFAATGYTGLPVTSTSPAVPKAIIELIRFNGDGSLDVPGATRSVNGTITQIPAGGTGSYTVADLVPPDGACRGTITFSPGGPHFDLFIAPKGERMWMIQTDTGNVFQGTATKVSH